MDNEEGTITKDGKLKVEPIDPEAQLKRMVIMMGIPRSGKSTVVRDILLSNGPPYQVVCADDIRLSMGHQYDIRTEPLVRAVSETMVRAFMVRGLPVIIDSTNVKSSLLDSWTNMADEFGYAKYIKIVNTSEEECIRRNVGKGSVPADVIIKMSTKLKEILETYNFEKKGISAL